MISKFNPNRRMFLAGTSAIAAVGVAEAIVGSKALAFIDRTYKNAPRHVPNARLNPEAFRTWFFKREN